MKANLPLGTGATIGILGGGQLGRMLALAAARLGFKTHIFCPENPSAAAEVSAKHTIAEYNDHNALLKFAEQVDIITYEFENIPVFPLKQIADKITIFPGIEALEFTQDRLVEKQFLQSCNISVADHEEINSIDDLKKALKKLGLPAILKTRRFGYDGKGQYKINSERDIEKIDIDLAQTPTILEKIVPFDRELSIITARGTDGSVGFYDLAHNVHLNQILKETHIPSPATDHVFEIAKDIAQKFADKMNYVGVFAIEFFHLENNNATPLIVNEIAPRVHNSGHWTLDACTSCQFENHIRAVVGWTLGGVERHSDALMTNLIGHDMDELNKWVTDKSCAVHLYGKEEVREGRKMGHVTRLIEKKKL